MQVGNRHDTYMNMNAKKMSLAMSASLFTAVAFGQTFSIDWFTIDGGGGPSSGGDFTLNGTIGQPEAGTMSGDNYSLAGGFWGALQTPPPVPTVIEVWVINGEVHLRFNGIPGRIYEIERARFVTGPWRSPPPNDQPLAVITMPIGGVVEFVDTTGVFVATQFFYRTSTR